MESLRTWRKSNGVSQAKLASKIGVTDSALCKYETGQLKLSPELAKRIETATNGEVTAAELLGLTAPERLEKGVRETARPFEAATVKVSVPADLAEIARKYGLDVEALVAEGGVPRLREAFKDAYIMRHKEAIDEINASVREHGTLSQRFGTI